LVHYCWLNQVYQFTGYNSIKNHLPASEAQLARVHLLAAAEPQAPQAPQRCFAVLGQRQGFEGLDFGPGEAPADGSNKAMGNPWEILWEISWSNQNRSEIQ
jgi:hypothetical protein